MLTTFDPQNTQLLMCLISLVISYVVIGAVLTLPALIDLSRKYLGVSVRQTAFFFFVAVLVLLAWPVICIKFFSQVD